MKPVLSSVRQRKCESDLCKSHSINKGDNYIIHNFLSLITHVYLYTSITKDIKTLQDFGDKSISYYTNSLRKIEQIKCTRFVLFLLQSNIFH